MPSCCIFIPDSEHESYDLQHLLGPLMYKFNIRCATQIRFDLIDSMPGLIFKITFNEEKDRTWFLL